MKANCYYHFTNEAGGIVIGKYIVFEANSSEDAAAQCAAAIQLWDNCGRMFIEVYVIDDDYPQPRMFKWKAAARGEIGDEIT